MAWFVATEYKDSDEGTYWYPDFKSIPAEQTRFDAMCKAVAADVYAKWEAEGEIADTPDHPENHEVDGASRLLWGRRFPMPDRPFQTQFVHEQTEPLVDIVGTPFGYGLSQKVIDMIESIEPGVHQYLPLEFLNPDGSISPEKRWLLNITTRAETVKTDESNVVWFKDVNGEDYEFSPRKYGDLTANGGKRQIVIDAQKSANRALWKEWRYRTPGGLGFMVSDRLWTMIQDAGVRGWSTAFITDNTHMEER